jgi:hypothetical protein
METPTAAEVPAEQTVKSPKYPHNQVVSTAKSMKSTIGQVKTD